MTAERLRQLLDDLQHETVIFEKCGRRDSLRSITNAKNEILMAFRYLKEENERLKNSKRLNFIEAKQKKQRGVSVRELAEETLSSANKYDALLVVGVSFGGGLDIGFSGDNEAELIGMAEVAKSILVEGIRDAE